MKMNKMTDSHLLVSLVFVAVAFVLIRNTTAIFPKDIYRTNFSPRIIRSPELEENDTSVSEDESLIGELIRCTYEEKICFGYNTLYHPGKRRCVLSTEEWCHLMPLKLRRLMEKEIGSQFSMCPEDNDHCSGPQTSPTETCDKARARRISCTCGIKPTRLVSGGAECRCWSNAVHYVSQPPEKGLCRIPLLLSPENYLFGIRQRIDPLDFFIPELQLKCSEEQRKCFSLGKVWMPGKTGCFRLLERGPCPKGHILALDDWEVYERNAKVVCVEKCPAGKLRMLFDGQCHKKRDMKLISVSPIFITIYGKYQGFPETVRELNASVTVSQESCVVHHSTYSEINKTVGRGSKQGEQNTNISAVFESRGPDISTQTNTTSVPPQSTATPPVGVSGFRRFHANDSFIGRPVPCTFEEKICFGYNTLFNPETGRCLDKAMEGDKVEFLNGSGHLFAREHSPDPCPGYRMAYDGRCYQRNIVHDVICGCDAEPTPHFLGGWECRCSPSTPVHVEQPKEEGRCRIPDLRFPDYFRSQMRNESWRDNLNGDKCSDEQRRCFLENKVWMEDERECFTLNERGPCADDHVVVLTKEKFINGSAVCSHIRNGCEPGFLRLAVDGKCHDEREVKVSLPGFTLIYRNMFGEHYVEDFRHSDAQPSAGFSPEICLFSLKPVETRICAIYQYEVRILVAGLSGWNHLARSECGPNDNDRCILYEIEAEPPWPDY